MWDDGDMVEQIHEHGSLAGIERVHNGHTTPNLYSREIPIGPMHRPEPFPGPAPHNQRTGEYGGSLENRLRLFHELLEETKEAVGDIAAVTIHSFRRRRDDGS